MSERIRKVNELIKHLVAGAMREADTGGFVTVKAVETSRDMRYADVWISIFGKDEKETLNEIENQRSAIQRIMNSKIKAKHVPVLSFKVDHSGEHAQRIEDLLKDAGSES